MSLDSIIKNIDVSKVTAPTGLTFGQELVNAANLLRDCIQERIDVESMKGCINASDLADITVNDDSMTIAVNIKPDLRPSIFNGTNGKVANIFWLLNDGFLVRKDWYFDNFAYTGPAAPSARNFSPTLPEGSPTPRKQRKGPV